MAAEWAMSAFDELRDALADDDLDDATVAAVGAEVARAAEEWLGEEAVQGPARAALGVTADAARRGAALRLAGGVGPGHDPQEEGAAAHSAERQALAAQLEYEADLADRRGGAAGRDREGRAAQAVASVGARWPRTGRASGPPLD